MEGARYNANQVRHRCLMGPYSEMRQLSRRGAVLQLLQKDNLSEWARTYWGRVYDTIAMEEDRYNARVAVTFKNARSGEAL